MKVNFIDKIIDIAPLFIVSIAFFLVLISIIKKEIKARRKLKESLDDDRIFDPITGVYISLEEAESGQWSTGDREKHNFPNTHLNEENKNIKIALDYLSNNEYYKKLDTLPNQEIDIINSSRMFSEYDEWTFTYCYEFDKGFVFLPEMKISISPDIGPFYFNSKIMFSLKINSLIGHYGLKPKESGEKFHDLFRSNGHLTLNNYETFTFRHSHNIREINKFLKHFENEKNLELEINDTHLIIKSLNLITIHDIKRIEKIIQHIYT